MPVLYLISTRLEAGGIKRPAQMVVGLLLFIVFMVFVYTYAYYNPQFSATASAIRQVWSGSCRFSCRRSENSGLSGLSGITAYQGQVGPPAPGGNCVCQSCPCAIIEDVLRTCSPATELYTYVVYTFSNVICAIVQSIVELCKSFCTVVECRTACQRQAQMGTDRLYFNSTENFSFSGKEYSDKAETVTLESEPRSQKKPEPLSDPGVSKASLIAEAGSSKGRKWESAETLKPDVSSSHTCSKCIEKGRTCISNCPRANVKDKK